MTTVIARANGHSVLVGRPDGSDLGTYCLDVAELMARASRAGLRARAIRPAAPVNGAVLALVSRDGGPVSPARTGAWLRARWALASARGSMRAATASASAGVWREIYRELRRHIGDERLPFPLRTRLRSLADWCVVRSSRAGALGAAPVRSRRLLRELEPVMLPPALAASAEAEAAGLGVRFDRPVVALHVRARPSLFHDAVASLLDAGHAVVRIGDAPAGLLRYPDVAGGDRPAVVDLTGAPGRTEAVDLLVLLRAAFVVCDSADVQRLAYLGGTPCLRLAAHDPIEAYPLGSQDLFTLATAVDLETGRVLSLGERVAERYLRHLDRFGHRPGSAAEIAAAVREMRQNVAEAAPDSEAQARFRAQVIEAATELAPRLPAVRAWGPDHGFIGDGRLARVQADVLS